LNIYIYGNSGFKKEIHQTLEHANIKFKLDDDSVIKDITNLDELKQAINENPNDIYLIDDEKIIKKNGISKKIKFLTPKDGIEEEFLLDNGIADVSVDSLNEIPKYILDKHEQLKSSEIHDSIVDIVDEAYSENDDYYDEQIELDDELSQLLAGENNESFNDIDDLVDMDTETNEEKEMKEDSLDDFDFGELPTFDENDSDILDDENISLEQDFNLDDIDGLLGGDDDTSSEEISQDDLNSMINFDEDVGLDNITKDYDDEESVNKNSKDEDLSEIDKVLENEDIIEEMDNLDSFPELEGLDDLDKLIEDNNLDDIDIDDTLSELDSIDSLDMEDAMSSLEDTVEVSNTSISNIINEESNKGVSMADEFSELDSLNEADILSALEGMGDIKPSTSVSSPAKVNSVVSETSSSNNIEVSSSNTQDIADLISKLLNNKTLEITIKIKD